MPTKDHFTSEGDLYLTTNPDRVVEEHHPRRGAHVEIIDPTGDPRIIVPTVVRVNGTDVGLIAQDGIKVDAGSNEDATTVTLVLLASNVEIKSTDEAGQALEDAREAVETAQKVHQLSSIQLHDAQLALRAAEGKG